MKLVIETDTNESVVSLAGVIDDHGTDIADAITAGVRSGVLYSENKTEEATWELLA